MLSVAVCCSLMPQLYHERVYLATCLFMFTNVHKNIMVVPKRSKAMKKTTDYDKFKLLKYNRRVDVNHAEMIKKKILISNELHINPIQVTKDFEVINGQHRLTAARELGVPIYYEVVDPFDPSSILHSNYAKAWSTEDYIHYYAQMGNAEHQKIIDLCHKYNLPVTGCLMLLNHGLRKQEIANFKVREDRLFALHKTMQFRNQLLNEAPEGDLDFRNTVRNVKFLEVILTLIDSNKFNIERLHKRLISHHYRVKARARKADYVELILEIYNYGLANKVTL